VEERALVVEVRDGEGRTLRVNEVDGVGLMVAVEVLVVELLMVALGM